MYVCLCNGVTERDIRQAVDAGCRSMPELTMRTGCGATCGSCVAMATGLIESAQACRAQLQDNVLPFPQISHAA